MGRLLIGNGKGERKVREERERGKGKRLEGKRRGERLEGKRLGKGKERGISE